MSAIKRPNSRSGSLGQFYRRRARMAHESCAVAMLPDPKNPEGPRIIPWIERPGRTYNIGRNADKRAKRVAALARVGGAK